MFHKLVLLVQLNSITARASAALEGLAPSHKFTFQCFNIAVTVEFIHTAKVELQALVIRHFGKQHDHSTLSPHDRNFHTAVSSTNGESNIAEPYAINH